METDISQSEFHFLLHSCAFMTLITPFSEVKSETHYILILTRFYPILAFYMFRYNRAACQVYVVRQNMQILKGAHYRPQCPSFSLTSGPFLVIVLIFLSLNHHLTPFQTTCIRKTGSRLLKMGNIDDFSLHGVIGVKNA